MYFRTVYIMINYLQQKNIPHNIFITRALVKDLNVNDFNNSRNCVRVFIWARISSGKFYIHKALIFMLLLIIYKYKIIIILNLSYNLLNIFNYF